MLKQRFGWRTAIPVALMSVTAVVVTSAPASATTETTQFVNVHSTNMCITTGEQLGLSAKIEQYTCIGSPSQTWVPGGSPGAYKNQNSHLCLTNGGSMANSAPLTQYTCNGNSNQTWSPWYPPGNTSVFELRNGTSHKCMTNGGSTGNNAPITQYTCNANGTDTNQLWHN